METITYEKLPHIVERQYAAEQAFVLQNEYRKSAGKQSIVWSDVLYEICKARAKELVNDFSHNKFISTSTELLEKKGYSIYKLSKRTGIRESTLYAIINNNTSIKNIKFDTVHKIATELDIPSDWLYKNID